MGKRREWVGLMSEEQEKQFRERYWGERIAIKDDPASVRVEGVQYILKKETDHFPGFKGHGGRDFFIKFNDGRLVHTTNLWLNGDIPEKYRAELHDNAVFIGKQEFERLRHESSRAPENHREGGREM